jgi:hypothetical protein
MPCSLSVTLSSRPSLPFQGLTARLVVLDGRQRSDRFKAQCRSIKEEPRRESLATLHQYSSWLLAFDRDQAGDNASRAWWARSKGKARLLSLASGVNDLNEIVMQGGDLVTWLRREFDRLGWRWPRTARMPAPDAYAC